MKRETKRKRQMINRAAGFTGSFMPEERAQSIARKRGIKNPSQKVIESIRKEDQATKKRLTDDR